MKIASIFPSCNEDKVIIELSKNRPEDPDYAFDDKGRALRFDTVYDARKYCKEQGWEVLHSLVPRKRLNVIADVDFIPGLEQLIAEAEQGTNSFKKEIDALRAELAQKAETYEMMVKSLNSMKEDHEELSIRRELDEGIKEFGDD